MLRLVTVVIVNIDLPTTNPQIKESGHVMDMEMRYSSLSCRSLQWDASGMKGFLYFSCEEL